MDKKISLNLLSCAINGDIDLARRLLRSFGEEVKKAIDYTDEVSSPITFIKLSLIMIKIRMDLPH
jgi:hypothetical protein